MENARLHDRIAALAVVEERERIGRDLHDGIIQRLYAVSLSLEDLGELANEDPVEVGVRGDRAIDSLHTTIGDIRHFILGLRPGLLASSDLAEGLERLAEEVRFGSVIAVETDIDAAAAAELDDEQATQLLGLSREALSNVTRHSAASAARVSFAVDDGILLLTIEDDGVGFDPEGVSGPDHQGLTNMRDRAAMLGGALAIERPEHHGTRVVARIPWTGAGRAGVSGDTSARTNGDGPARMLRLLIVDDHEIVRQGLVALLDRREGFAVVAEAGTVAEAIEQAERHHPDIVVMDVRLPDGSGIEACREIRAEMPDTKVVMLTSYPDEEAVLSAIVAGASGYLLKQIRARDLVAALEAVGRGESLLDPAVTEKVLERIRRMASGTYTDELAAADPAGAEDPAARRRGQDQQGDRRRRLPVRQDGQELRQLDPRQAEPGAPSAGRGLRGQSPPRRHAAGRLRLGEVVGRQLLTKTTENSSAPWSAIERMKPPTFGATIPKSDSGNATDPATWI